MTYLRPDKFVSFDAFRVGLVEDNAYFRRLVRAMLSGFGIRQIYEATTLAEGWEIVSERRPDILLLDWNLDGDNGLKLLDRIRCHPDDAIATQAVVFLSAHTDKRHVLQAAWRGANDFIVKPVSARVLYDRLRRLSQSRALYQRRDGRLVLMPSNGAWAAPVQRMKVVPSHNAEYLYL